MELVLPTSGTVFHCFRMPLNAGNAIDDINVPQLCFDNGLSSKDCAFIGEGVEIFLDNWLLNITRFEVVRVADFMISSWSHSRG